MHNCGVQFQFSFRSPLQALCALLSRLPPIGIRPHVKLPSFLSLSSLSLKVQNTGNDTYQTTRDMKRGLKGVGWLQDA